MTRNAKLEDLIGSSIDPATLPKFDPTAIAEQSATRTRRRRLIAASSLVAAGLVGSAAVIGVVLGDDRGGTEPAAVAPPKGGPAMGCGVPPVSTEAESGTDVVLQTTNVGTPTSTAAVLRPAPQFRVERAVLIVAKPGSTGDAGDPAKLPATAALRPENQVSVGPAVTDSVPAGQALGVNFKPQTPGRYPVFAARWFYESENCAAPAPPPGPRTTAPGIAVMQLGEIVVQ